MARVAAAACTLLAACFGSDGSSVDEAGAGATPETGFIVELAWDADPGEAFAPSTCRGAGVESMRYTVRGDGDLLQRVVGVGPCRDELLVDDVAPATYELDLHGLDADGQERWTTTCTGLTWSTEGERYACDVPSTP